MCELGKQLPAEMIIKMAVAVLRDLHPASSDTRCQGRHKGRDPKGNGLEILGGDPFKWELRGRATNQITLI